MVEVKYSLFTLQPPNWLVPACQMGTNVGIPNYPFQPLYNSSGVGYENEDFIVWMRTAGMLCRVTTKLRSLPCLTSECYFSTAKLPKAVPQADWLD